MLLPGYIVGATLVFSPSRLSVKTDPFPPHLVVILFAGSIRVRGQGVGTKAGTVGRSVDRGSVEGDSGQECTEVYGRD